MGKREIKYVDFDGLWVEWLRFAFPPYQLETDSKILLEKADTALEKYKMNAVVANELSTRKEEVVVVTSAEKILVQRDKSQPGNDVENPLIKLLSERHLAYIEDSGRWFYRFRYQVNNDLRIFLILLWEWSDSTVLKPHFHEIKKKRKLDNIVPRQERKWVVL